MKWLLTIMLLCAAAEAEPLVHMGASAGINGVMYTLCTGAMNRQVDLRPGCLVTSSLLTGTIGLLSEINDAQSGPLDTHDLALDAIGITASAIIIYLVDIRGKSDKPANISFTGNGLQLAWRW